MTFLALAIINSVAIAADSSKFLLLEESPRQTIFSNVFSLQPAIITDAECNKIFSDNQIITALQEQDIHLRLLDIMHRKIRYKPINGELTARFVSSVVTIHLPGKKTLMSPELSSGQVNNKTHEYDGQFFNDYCHGNFHLKNMKREKNS